MGKLNVIAEVITDNGRRIYQRLNNCWQSCQRYISGNRPLPPAQLRIKHPIKFDHAPVWLCCIIQI